MEITGRVVEGWGKNDSKGRTYEKKLQGLPEISNRETEEQGGGILQQESAKWSK